MKKKFLTIFLAFAIVMTFMPSMAFADPVETGDQLPETITVLTLSSETARPGIEYRYYADTQLLELYTDVILKGTLEGTLAPVGVDPDTLEFDDFHIISNGDHCIDTSHFEGVLYIKLIDSTSNTMTLNEKETQLLTGKQGVGMPIYMPEKTLQFAGTGSISISNNVPDKPAVVCKDLKIGHLGYGPSAVKFFADCGDGVIDLKLGNEVTIDEGIDYYIYGSQNVNGKELTEAYFSEGNYLVEGQPAKSLMFSKEPLEPEQSNDLIKKIVKGVAIAAGAAAVVGVVGTVAKNVQKAVVANQMVFQAKMQQQMVQKQVAAIKSVLKGAGVVLSLASFGSSLSNLFKLNQFGYR